VDKLEIVVIIFVTDPQEDVLSAELAVETAWTALFAVGRESVLAATLAAD